MSYQVLARKWRPRDFIDVAGQDATIKILQNSLDRNNLHQAYLFTGTRGVGKTTIARIVARSLICEQGISSKPCNVCSLCQAVINGNCPDVIEIDAASKTKVEDTRELLDTLVYMPSVARFKIYIIDEVHMLSMHSFNALLKSLEEPPAHIKFLLATTDPQKLPITVLSRCIQFELKMFSTLELSKQLEKILIAEKRLFEPNAILPIATAARGSMRDGLSLLERVLAFTELDKELTNKDVCSVLGIPDPIKLIDLLTAIINYDPDLVILMANKFAEEYFDLTKILQELQVMLKNIAILQITNSAVLDPIIPHKDLLLNLAKKLTPEECQLFYEIVVNGFKNLPFTPDPKTGFEMILLRMVAFRPIKASSEVLVNDFADHSMIKDLDNCSPMFLRDPKVDTTEKRHDTVLDAHSQSKCGESIQRDNLEPLPNMPVSSKDKAKEHVVVTEEELNNHDNILSNLHVSRLTKELLENVVLEEITEELITLILDEEQKILITKKNIENLQTAFSKYLDKKNIKVKVKVENIKNNQQLIKKTLKWQKQHKLTTFINKDQNLQQLINNFDAKVEEINDL